MLFLFQEIFANRRENIENDEGYVFRIDDAVFRIRRKPGNAAGFQMLHLAVCNDVAGSRLYVQQLFCGWL